MIERLLDFIDWPDFGLTPYGKRLACIIGGLILAVIGLVFDAIMFSIFGMILSTAAALDFWIARVPPPCPGPKSVFTSPSGEMEIGLCYGCDSWRLDVRGETKGNDRGWESLVARLRDLASTHSNNVPHLATEMRTIADHVEGMESLGDPDTPPVPSENVMDPQAAMRAAMGEIDQRVEAGMDPIDAIREAVNAGLPDGVSAEVSVPLDDYMEFIRWRNSQPDQEEQDVRTDEEPPGD